MYVYSKPLHQLFNAGGCINHHLLFNPGNAVTTSNPFATVGTITVRLVSGSSSREGRVEVYHQGSWGTVCDNNWDNRDARVVCRQLGFSVLNAQAFLSARYGRGSGSILLDNIGCTGNETNLGQCTSRGWYIHHCGHHEDASVRCSKL